MCKIFKHIYTYLRLIIYSRWIKLPCLPRYSWIRKDIINYNWKDGYKGKCSSSHFRYIPFKQGSHPIPRCRTFGNQFHRFWNPITPFQAIPKFCVGIIKCMTSNDHLPVCGQIVKRWGWGRKGIPWNWMSSLLTFLGSFLLFFLTASSALEY